MTERGKIQIVKDHTPARPVFSKYEGRDSNLSDLVHESNLRLKMACKAVLQRHGNISGVCGYVTLATLFHEVELFDLLLQPDNFIRYLDTVASDHGFNRSYVSDELNLRLLWNNECAGGVAIYDAGNTKPPHVTPLLPGRISTERPGHIQVVCISPTSGGIAQLHGDHIINGGGRSGHQRPNGVYIYSK